jgi:hypothetical protein
MPIGIAVVGCGSHSTPVTYCTAGDSGPIVGQVATIVLAPNFATVGESLNFGQIGSTLAATAYDCRGNAVSTKAYVYASTSSFNVNTPAGPIYADINPGNGQVCGGTWNRNTGGGIPNYTTCTPPTSTPANFLAYVTATSNGAVSNAIPVYVHPTISGIVLGQASTTASCLTDPGTDCAGCSPSTIGTVTTIPPVYDPGTTPGGCLSQNTLGLLVARVYAGAGASRTNITCQVGHVTLSAQTPNILTIDETGIATAHQPGSSIITASLSNSASGSQAGYFATCPPASITLAIPSQPGVSDINVPINTTQPIVASILDTKGVTITGLALEFNSTTPQTIPVGTGTVTPTFPGSADITATCLPSLCNPSPFSQIGLFGNGKPVTSNPITVTASGVSSTVLYMGSTESQYIQARDFTTNQPGSLIKLPYLPNSMVINQAGTTIYFGSAQGLMSIATSTNVVGTVNQAILGNVLAVSPDGSTLVVTDPSRQTISLVNSSGGVSTTYGGVGTHAQFTPDSQAIYVTTTAQTVLTHSAFTDWQPATTAEINSDVAVTVPYVGAYFASGNTSGSSTTDGRSYCSSSTPTGTGSPPKVNNVFIPVADRSAAITDRIAATTDSRHIIGAHAPLGGGPITVTDIAVALPQDQVPPVYACPQTVPVNYFQSSFTTYPVPGVTAAVDAASTPTIAPLAITGVFPSSNSGAAFITYTGSTTTGASAHLPVYFPAATGVGTLSFVPLANGATAASAPVAGVFSTDDFSFYAGTEGDNQVHIISLTYPTGAVPTAAETGVITPNLPNVNGATSSPVNLLAQHPKRSTS